MKLTFPTCTLNGDLALTADYTAKVGQAILEAILTKQQERVYRPSYGRSVDPFDTAGVTEVLADLRRAIDIGLEGFPDVTFRLYGSYADDGKIDVTCEYNTPQSQDGLSVTI